MYRVTNTRLKLRPSFTPKFKLFNSRPSLSTRPLRWFSTQGIYRSPQTRSWVTTSFLNLLFLFGLGAAAYGVYDIHDSLAIWPPEVRSDLRSGLRAKQRGDLDTSEQNLQRAWTTAKSLPISLFASEPHLKISGIAVCLASVLEESHKLECAFKVYEEVLERLPEKWEYLSGKEKFRAIGIAYRLGEMAETIDKEKEEGYLAWAVEALLKSVKDDSERKSGDEFVGKSENVNDEPVIKMLQLPEWATKVDIAAPFEALGSFYARTGRLEYAMVLYLQAISVLVPPPPQSTSLEARCRGAQLMTALSDLIMRNPNSKSVTETLQHAELWSKKSLDIAMQHSSASSISNVARDPNCDIALAFAAYNVGILKKMMGDNESARLHFEQSLKVSKMIGMEAGIQNAEDALSKIDKETDQE